ncbi:MAG: DUF362 domain-containing protein, partial [Firmicutes bacterium]|nr:DUF362 domain-containing protein [Bacillota bacterium]
HRLGLHRPLARLATVLPVHLTIVDAICGDLTFEEGGNPAPMGRLLAGTDPVLLDSYAASLLGLAVEEVTYLELAAKLGVGTTDLTRAVVHEVNPEGKQAGCFQLTGRAKQLARYVEERDACSACYGSLLHALHRMAGDGELEALRRRNQKIKIGQGFRGQKSSGVGIGTCTRGMDEALLGCPPTAWAIRNFLRRVLAVQREA